MKRLYSAILLISLFFGLNCDGPDCDPVEDSQTGCTVLTGETAILYTCAKPSQEGDCVLTQLDCANIDSTKASALICPKAKNEDPNKKCVYSEDKKCELKDLCSSITGDNASDKNCQGFPTTDDTKKICSYDSKDKKCKEVDKPAEENNGSSNLLFIKSLALIFFICLLY